MSGHLRVVSPKTPVNKHDHVDLEFENGQVLRFNDPRRFGSLHWFEEDPHSHPLLKELGPEPLSENFDGEYLFLHSRKRTTPVKTFVMNSHVVVGVGNIYANESLFQAGIRPQTAAGRISRKRYSRLAQSIKQVLSQAIKEGGTSLRDYLGSNGEPGYFGLQLSVYGRAGESCDSCDATLKGLMLGQRQTVYCPRCQSR